MAIEDLNYQEFVKLLTEQVNGLLPVNFQEFQKNYIINTTKKFSLLAGESINKDKSLNYTTEQKQLVIQIIAEWSFHKSVDMIKAGIPSEQWDNTIQKIIFTIFEIAKQGISKELSEEQLLQLIDHHVEKTYKATIIGLESRGIINKIVLNKALEQSNINDMIQQKGL